MQSTWGLVGKSHCQDSPSVSDQCQMVRDGLSWTSTGSAPSSQGWLGLQDPSLGLSYLWGSGTMPLVCLEAAGRKHSMGGTPFMGLILALHPPREL